MEIKDFCLKDGLGGDFIANLCNYVMTHYQHCGSRTVID